MSSFEEQLFFSLLIILLIQLVYFVGTLVGNWMLFGKMGERKWLGLIPVVDKYVIFKFFWSKKAFITYCICAAIYFLISKFGMLNANGTSSVCVIAFLIISIILLFFYVALYDKISHGFGKGFLWTIGLLICYPLFIIILVKTTTLTEEFQNKIQEKEPR